LALRVPSARADTFINRLADFGIPLDRNLTTQSLEAERDELASRFKARRAMLQDYYAMLKESSDSTIFTIQSEIVNLQSEIEQTAGEIQKLDDRMAFAEISVFFRFQERGAPLTTGQSRFRWLNRLDLPTLMGRFDYVRH
jgi:CRISPR/Cas system Type II protein with McrA/HNH and RuvC-like nuclease domain